MINVLELSEILHADLINIGEENRVVECGYAGDFLSNAISKAPTNCAWFTVMNNVNVCAVATLADVSIVVLCENTKPDENLLQKVKMQGVNMISTKHDIFLAIKTVADKI